MKKLEITYLAIEEIKPYKNNPRKNDKAIETVAKSIKEFGFKNPVIIDKNNEIIAGHTRIKSIPVVRKLLEEEFGNLQDKGELDKAAVIEKRIEELNMIPIIRAEDLTDAQVKAFRIMDNRSSELAEWDNDLLKEEFYALESTDAFEFTGFDSSEITDIWDKDKQVEEDVIEVNAYERAKNKTKIQPGEIYQLGNHRLMCGDSTKKENVDALMGENKADVVFTDPPYGMFLDADFSSMKGIGVGKKYEQVKGDNEDFKPEIITSIFDNFNYCKEIFLWGADYYAELIPERNKGSLVVWDKMCGEEGPKDAYDKMFGSNFEICWSKKKHKRAFARVLWKRIFGLGAEDTKKRVHPTQKPVKLSDWFLSKFSKVNQKIVDLFGGSGSTLIACEQLNRKCFMMELDPVYVQVIIDRWEKLTKKTAVKI